jgi:hypothetical protein
LADPAQPYAQREPMLPLQLTGPSAGRAGIPVTGIGVHLSNPGDEAPNSRLRIIIHGKDNGYGHRDDLTPDNVKVEVLEGGAWKAVRLVGVDDGLLGAIGSENVTEHRDPHGRGGFAIGQGFNRTFPLRVTFGVAGTYTLLVAVSPDNGSRHLAQPADLHIEVR